MALDVASVFQDGEQNDPEITAGPLWVVGRSDIA